jgi:hypothetical protein
MMLAGTEAVNGRNATVAFAEHKFREKKAGLERARLKVLAT